ncbi:cell division protein FtsX [Lichenicola sp.]|uniref:cell division protein FtsX n=1 Tax=Lichenicola sp. TaxID=2804529 RepID=UPI003AFFCEDB
MMARAPSAKSSRKRSDGLALRRALSDRLLPALVAAMTFLASLALAGAVGASLLASRWSSGAASVLTVQVPDGDQAAASGGAATTRIDAVAALLSADSAFVSVHRLDAHALAGLLSPWLGDTASIALPLPAVVELRLRAGQAAPSGLAARLDQAAPGTLVESNGAWSDRLVVLTTSLQACAGLALLVVAGVAVAVVAVATRAGLAARRQAIEIVHGLGASDSYIAGRFARRATSLAVTGGALGTIVSVPLLLTLCRLAAPFAAPPGPTPLPPGMPDPLAALQPGALGFDALEQAFGRMPLPLWIALPLLPVMAAAIGWCTAQATVRTWLRRLP